MSALIWWSFFFLSRGALWVQNLTLLALRRELFLTTWDTSKRRVGSSKYCQDPSSQKVCAQQNPALVHHESNKVPKGDSPIRPGRGE